MVRLLTNIFTNTGKDVMNGWYWEYTSWFWQTNWLIFEIWLLVFPVSYTHLDVYKRQILHLLVLRTKIVLHICKINGINGLACMQFS